MNKVKIQTETRELYHDAGIKTLKGLIFLTLCTRNIFTKMAIFIISAIVPLFTSIFLYANGIGFIVFPTAMIVHFCICQIAFLEAEKDGMRESFEEQQVILKELRAILAEKRLFKQSESNT